MKLMKNPSAVDACASTGGKRKAVCIALNPAINQINPCLYARAKLHFSVPVLLSNHKAVDVTKWGKNEYVYTLEPFV